MPTSDLSPMFGTWAAGILAVFVVVYYAASKQKQKALNIPRIGPLPGALGNTSSSYFSCHSFYLINEGYFKAVLPLPIPKFFAHILSNTGTVCIVSGLLIWVGLS